MNLYIAMKLKQRAKEERSELATAFVNAIAVSFTIYFYFTLICILLGGGE